jgi:hypothetical protein
LARALLDGYTQKVACQEAKGQLALPPEAEQLYSVTDLLHNSYITSLSFDAITSSIAAAQPRQHSTRKSFPIKKQTLHTCRLYRMHCCTTLPPHHTTPHHTTPHHTTPHHTTYLLWRHSEVDDPEVLLQPMPHKHTPSIQQVVQLQVCRLERHKVMCAAAGVEVSCRGSGTGQQQGSGIGQQQGLGMGQQVFSFR